MMKKLGLAIPVLAIALGGTTACATKKFVRTNVGEVNEKVDTLSKSVEETQERTRANEGKITEVDQRAQAGITAASKRAVPVRRPTPSTPAPTRSSARRSGSSTKLC